MYYSKNINSKIIECIGPEIISFKEILMKTFKFIDKKRILIPFFLPIAKFECKIFSIIS